MMDSALSCQCNMIILLDSLTHLDIPGMQAQHLTHGIHLAESCERHCPAKECRSYCETWFFSLIWSTTVQKFDLNWIPAYTCPAKGMPPRSRERMRNVSVINTEIIIIKFWALYTTGKHKTISANGLCFRIWILKSNTVKWEVSSLGVSKAIPKHLENPSLFFRSPNM